MISKKLSVYFVQFQVVEKKLFLYDLNILEGTQVSQIMLREVNTGWYGNWYVLGGILKDSGMWWYRED